MKFTDIISSDASIEAKIEAISIILDKKVEELQQISAQTSQIPGPEGEKGEKGDRGFPGKDGKDGIDGKDGKNGKDGTDGVDGKDGISVVDAYLDFDNSLVIKLSNGSEINAGYIEVAGQSKENVVQLLKNGALSLRELSPKNPLFSYTDGTLTNIIYGSGETKTFTYTGGVLVQLDFLCSDGLVRKVFNYNLDGSLAFITETVI